TATAIAGTIAVFIPGPGWLATGLAAVSTAAIGADLALNLHEGDYRAAVIDGLFLIPVAIGGVVKLVQITRLQLQALRAGHMITRFGTTFTLQEGRLIAVRFDPELGAHLSDVAKPNKDGISGGHNLVNFEQAFRDLGLDPAQAIISKTEIYPGVYDIKYQVPIRQPGGGLTGDWKVVNTPKTVYDPSVISDADMLAYATDAMRSARPVSPGSMQYEGWSHGIKFQGWLKDGQFTSVYPVDPWRK
ncbi:MAG: CdiA family toxin C-terminal domain-containing protein, partial [Propionibacteriaceae bacterium]|nr:CdiA family toxin C-terminal domain-containing protein [Propionibacteriaceae bacterium]